MIRRERRDGGEGEERGLRKGAEREQKEDRDREKRDKRELSLLFEEEDRNIDTCLCLLPQGTAFFLSSRPDSAVKRCSSEVIVSSGAAW